MLNSSPLGDARPDHGGAGRRDIGACDCPQMTWKKLVVLIAAGMMLPGLGFAQAPAPSAEASASSSAPVSIPQEKLDSLLAPIALYPDQLLAQALMAATYPLDVVAAARFVKENRDLKGDALDKAVAEKNWDPSVQSLASFPQVLEMMNDKLEWTQELGDAFLADQKRVMQTVQSLRQKAEAAGNLKSSEQIKVVKEQSVIIIEPAQPEVVYVPSYNPTVVYGTWWAPAYPPYYYPPPPYYYPHPVLYGAFAFGVGYAIGANNWGWGNCDWNGGNVNIDIDRNNNFINNNKDFKNKVNNGKWGHNPAQRKGVGYSDARTRDQYRKSDPGATASRRDARGYDSGSRTGPSAGTRDAGRGGGDFGGAGPSAGTRDMQRPSGGSSQFGGSAGSRDVQRPSGGSDFGGGGSSFDRGGGASSRPSFDSGHSRQQASSYSSRGASSRSSMGGGGYSGGGARGGGGRSGGGGRR